MSARVSVRVPDDTGLMLDKMKDVTKIDKQDLVNISIRQLYTTLSIQISESVEKNTS